VNHLRYHERVRTALAVLVLVIVGALVPAILFTSAGPDAPGAKAVAVALVLIQATTLLWMPKHPEAAMSVAIATGVGIEQLCPTLSIFGAAMKEICTGSSLVATSQRTASSAFL